MSPRTVDKSLKREQILKAALEVMIRTGVDNLKMIDVAREAGVGKGTLYEYFKSKGELIGGAFSIFIDDYTEFLNSKLNEITNPENRIRRIIELSISFFAEQHDRVEVMFYAWGSCRTYSDSINLTNKVTSKYDEMKHYLIGLLKEGVKAGKFRRMDYQTVASSMLALIDGLLFQVQIGMIDLKTPGLSKGIADTLMKGILK